MVPELRTEEQAGARGGSRPEPREWISQPGQDEPGQPDLGESQHICSRKVRQIQRKKIKESN